MDLSASYHLVDIAITDVNGRTSWSLFTQPENRFLIIDGTIFHHLIKHPNESSLFNCNRIAGSKLQSRH